ncbi:MAG: hypothetical protein QOF43_982 [Gaiellaceae bacterium]|nr:hypothetical protein [Gaiellaceae bacterium]
MKRVLLAVLTAALALASAGTAAAGLNVSALGTFSDAHPAPGSNPQPIYCGFGYALSCATVGFSGVDPNASRVLWGSPLGGTNTTKSGLTWLGSSGLATAFEAPFLIGKLTHANNPIAGSIDAVKLTYQLSVTDGAASVINAPVPVTINVEDTPNAPPCPYPSDPGKECSDRITWSVPASASVIPANASGGPYLLNILGFRATASASSPLVSQFISQEGGSNDAYLFATIGTAGSGAAVNDTYSTVVDQPLVQPAAGGLLANDLSPASVTSVTVLAQPAHGSVTAGPAGNFTYVPSPGYLGTDSFNYVSRYADGSLALATATITVVPDTTSPTIATPPVVVAEAAGAGGAIVTWPAPTASDPDDAAGPVTCSPASGSPFPLGTSTVSCSSTDSHGLTGTAEFSVVVLDRTPPTIVCPGALTVESNAPGGAHVIPADATASDLVSTPTITGPGAALYPLGSTTVTYGATDAAGNTSSCSTTITVVDTVAPAFHGVPADITAEATSPAGAAVSYTAPTVTELNPAGPLSCAPVSGGTFAFGSTTVTCTAADTSGHTATATFTITVVDTHAPVVNVPAPITINASGTGGASVTYAATATDTVDGAITPTCTPASGSTFAVGTTTVTCTATDAHANVGHASFTVTIRSVGAMLNDLLALATSLPPGKSLPAKVKVAQSNYAAGDIAGTCSMLAAFISEVSAQSGKQLTVAQATDLLDRARAIRTVLGC